MEKIIDLNELEENYQVNDLIRVNASFNSVYEVLETEMEYWQENKKTARSDYEKGFFDGLIYAYQQALKGIDALKQATIIKKQDDTSWINDYEKEVAEDMKKLEEVEE